MKLKPDKKLFHGVLAGAGDRDSELAAGSLGGDTKWHNSQAPPPAHPEDLCGVCRSLTPPQRGSGAPTFSSEDEEAPTFLPSQAPLAMADALEWLPKTEARQD